MYSSFIATDKLNNRVSPIISIIIPIFNVAPYLHRCLDSIINQSIKDIEIICVNDCSPDNSLSILKEYASKDKRIKIIDFEEGYFSSSSLLNKDNNNNIIKGNQGVSIARNICIQEATGEYIGFVDGDDWISENYYEELYKIAVKTNDDCVATSNIVLEYNNKNVGGGGIRGETGYHKMRFGTIWRCLFKRSIFSNYDEPVFIKEHKRHQDFTFLETRINSDKVYMTNKSIYHYSQQINNSLSFEYFNKKITYYEHVDIFNYLLYFYKKYNIKKALPISMLAMVLKKHNDEQLFYEKIREAFNGANEYIENSKNLYQARDLEFIRDCLVFAQYSDFLSYRVNNRHIVSKIYLFGIPLFRVLKDNNILKVLFLGFIPIYKSKKNVKDL